MLLSSAYFGDIRYWAAMLQAGTVAIDDTECHLTGAWGHHHCRICGAGGQLTLTVPIDKTRYTPHTPMRQVVISEHGHWRHQHWGALFSAYGTSPFFDYIAPDLEHIILGNQTSLLELNTQLLRLIISFLDLPITIAPASDAATPQDGARLYSAARQPGNDLRGKLALKAYDNTCPVGPGQHYYQPRAAEHGFLPDLGIIDLLCNTGREAIFTLLSCTRL